MGGWRGGGGGTGSCEGQVQQEGYEVTLWDTACCVVTQAAECAPGTAGASWGGHSLAVASDAF